jgi:DASH complex subunit DAD1
MDSVIANLNRLNRAMDPILVIGSDLSSIEALWSTFEAVMGDGHNHGNKEEETEKKEEVSSGDGA